MIVTHNMQRQLNRGGGGELINRCDFLTHFLCTGLIFDNLFCQIGRYIIPNYKYYNNNQHNNRIKINIGYP